MNNKFFTLAMLVMWAFPFASHAQVPVNSYFHLTGSANHEIPATFDLVKIGDSLYGTLTFGRQPAQPELPATVDLYGKWAGNLMVKMSDPNNGSGLHLTGTLTGELKFSATLKHEKGGSVDLSMAERYPAGSVEFLLYHEVVRQRLVKKQGSPRATLSYAVMVPAESGNPILSDTLKRIVQNCFFGDTRTSDETDTLLARMKRDFFGSYMSDNVSLYEAMPTGPSFNWEKLKYMHIVHNQDHLLTLYILNYAFTGGAHGLETHDYYSVDLKHGRLMHPRDLFKPGYEKELSDLLTKKLREQCGLTDKQLLSEAGYFTEEIKPGDNFYVLPTGVGFYYNCYDIAPYSFGATNLFLTYPEIRALLK